MASALIRLSEGRADASGTLPRIGPGSGRDVALLLRPKKEDREEEVRLVERDGRRKDPLRLGAALCWDSGRCGDVERGLGKLSTLFREVTPRA